MRVQATLLVLFIGEAALMRPVFGEPVEWRVEDGGNGHFYEFIEGPESQFVTWPDARTYAATRRFRGVVGHLATVTSLAEWKFLHDAFPGDGMSPNGAWLGGYQDKQAPDYEEPKGGWRWITGEPWSFTAWASSEPNDMFGAGSENYLEFVPVWGGKWNDEGQERRLVVEYPVTPPTVTGPPYARPEKESFLAPPPQNQPTALPTQPRRFFGCHRWSRRLCRLARRCR